MKPIPKLKLKTHHCKNGFSLSVCKIDEISHISISDANIYPDSDSRSQDLWRMNELLIPINNDYDFNEIKKLFNL